MLYWPMCDSSRLLVQHFSTVCIGEKLFRFRRNRNVLLPEIMWLLFCYLGWGLEWKNFIRSIISLFLFTLFALRFFFLFLCFSLYFLFFKDLL